MYFIVAGEWNASRKWRDDGETVRREVPLYIALDAPPATYRACRFDPRTGAWIDLGLRVGISELVDTPPDSRDWVLLLQRDGAG